MRADKKQYALYLDKEVYNKIKDFADNENRSFNNFVEMLLKNYIKEKEKECE